MAHGEVHGQGAEAAIRCKTEGRVLIEYFAVQMDADVSFHVLWAVVEYLQITDN